MDRYSKILLAIGAGVLASALGEALMGHLAAIAVPKGYFFWFQENLDLAFGSALLFVVKQVLGFGLLLLAAGYIITRALSLPTISVVSSLLTGFWLYLVVGSALVYGVPIINPISALSLYTPIMLFIHIFFVILGAVLGERYNRAIHATNA